MEAEDAAAAPPADAPADAPAGAEADAPPKLVTFVSVAASNNWADQVDEEDGDDKGRERARAEVLEALKTKYHSRCAAI